MAVCRYKSNDTNKQFNIFEYIIYLNQLKVTLHTNTTMHCTGSIMDVAM